MIRIDNAPIPEVRSRRKLGLEIEVSIGNQNRSVIDLNVQGWSRQTDGSIGNGWEFVFDGPVLVETAKDRIDRFCAALKEVNVHRAGGYHVHVQGNDYSKEDCYYIVMLYTKFQNVIDKLVAPSRVGNMYCRPWTMADLHHSVSPHHGVSAFMRTCGLERQDCSGRSSAKHISGRYRTVNLNMMACRDEGQRSVEFRQGSVSKRAGVVFGWASMLLAMTEAAKKHEKVAALPVNCSLQDMLTFLQEYERESGSSNISNWVQWRYDYLNQKPDDAELRLALEKIAESPIGLYGLSRKMDINLVVCKRLLAELMTKGLIFKRPGGTAYVASYEFKAAEDLKTILEAMRTRQTPVDVKVEVSSDLFIPRPPIAVLG